MKNLIFFLSIILSFSTVYGQKDIHTDTVKTHTDSLMKKICEGQDKKCELINKLVNSPNRFTPTDMNNLFKMGLSDFEVKTITKYVFEKNGFVFPNHSDAEENILGSLNKSSNAAKMRKYHRRIKNGVKDKGWKVIFVEGDSWYEYPWFIREITDQLNKRRNKFAIYSIAYGGDWLSNMLYNMTFLNDLPKVSPDVYLLSGGGNDMVGSFQIANFVCDSAINEILQDTEFIKKYDSQVIYRIIGDPPPEIKKDTVLPAIRKTKKIYAEQMARQMSFMNIYETDIESLLQNIMLPDSINNISKDAEILLRESLRNLEITINKLDKNTKGLAEKIILGRKYLNEKFDVYLRLLRLEYLFMLNVIDNQQNIKNTKGKEVQIIVQGYDYPIPSYKKGLFYYGFRPIRCITNILMHNGYWIKHPMMMKGITDKYIQECIVAAMIFAHNNMLEELTKDCEELYYIDCRRTVEYLQKRRGKMRYNWYNELHPSSFVFNKIAKVFNLCIKDYDKGKTDKKIYKVIDYID